MCSGATVHPKHSAAKTKGDMSAVLFVKNKTTCPFRQPKFRRFFAARTVNLRSSSNVVVLFVLAHI